MRNRGFLTLLAGGSGVNRDILAAEVKAYDKIYGLLEALRREAIGDIE